jgi:hypothetical protein
MHAFFFKKKKKKKLHSIYTIRKAGEKGHKLVLNRIYPGKIMKEQEK